jgi:hypothetical protein
MTGVDNIVASLARSILLSRYSITHLGVPLRSGDGVFEE